MTFKEFGNVIEPAGSREFTEFGEVIEPLSRPRSLAHAPVKGAVKRAGDIAEMVQSLAPFIPKGPLTKEKAYQFAEENLPTLEREPEKFLERGGGVALESLLTPGGPLVKGAQVAAGTTLGYLTEKLGAPEWAQSIAEGLPFFFSGGKKIPLKPDQKKLGEFLRKQGLTENEITPLLKTPEQVNRWSTFASKGKKSRELMESLYQKTGGIYDSVIEQGKNLPPLNDKGKAELLGEFTKIWNDIPDKFRQLVKNDFKDFLTKGRVGAEDIINLDRDINAVIGPEAGGKAIVGLFKEPLKKAMNSIDPGLSEDYSLAKKFFSSRSKVKGALINPKDFDRFLDAGEAYAMGSAIFNRDLGKLGKVLSVAGARSLAREMLINPRLQNISTRIGEALKANKLVLAEKHLRAFNDILREDEPELASQIDELLPK